MTVSPFRPFAPSGSPPRPSAPLALPAARCRRRPRPPSPRPKRREGGGRQAVSGRDLRRLERVRRPGRQGTICYTLAQPKTREPASLKRDPGYAFISDRPAEGVRNEVSFIMGFDIAAGRRPPTPRPTPSLARSRRSPTPRSKTVRVAPAPVALVDEASFEMLPKGGNLWVKNAAKESALIAEMRKGAKLVIKAASLRGHQRSTPIR